MAGLRAKSIWDRGHDEESATDALGHHQLLLRAREVESCQGGIWPAMVIWLGPGLPGSVGGGDMEGMARQVISAAGKFDRSASLRSGWNALNSRWVGYSNQLGSREGEGHDDISRTARTGDSTGAGWEANNGRDR